ncbi:carboxylate-amine ligase [Paractinoplanes toevensis]|uniref:Putative glutamate--cysteine ligase 2 n=1 Tax=Paractinoplanes toevensis TaxID=571911 RepID=A0A919W8F8_9ACTN|nr:glutamate--cysteine ligase [Actinoplanes toevensis]GIM93636.1 putative glutamate--cysteine ligase 2-3 [Actinoplanes toevensis]
MSTPGPIPGQTLGVEEEFLLLDPHSGENVPVAGKVLSSLPESVRGQSRLEFRHSMVEMVTPVCTGLAELRHHLVDLRRAAAAAATGAGARLVAVGATPVAEPCREPTENPRFHEIARYYGPIAADPAVCGCHVHVGVPNRALAIEVGNHLREWLPVVQALTANSPLYQGADTGYASWRSVQLQRWPSLGPTPHTDSAADYDRTVAAMVSSGVMLDDSMVLWYSRPSATYPTVEVRVSDAGLTVDDTVLLAGLVRALVATIRDDIAAGRPALRIPDDLLRAAHWNAARTGLDGTLTDLRSRRARPAWSVVDELVAYVGPALHHQGDREVVEAQLARIRRDGTGAARQRQILRAGGDIGAVLDRLAELTVSG